MIGLLFPMLISIWELALKITFEYIYVKANSGGNHPYPICKSHAMLALFWAPILNISGTDGPKEFPEKN